ncbi:hypothetical protein [Deinococcus sp. UYEF24]
MDIFVNNPPAQVQQIPVQGYGAPAYGYAPQYGDHHGGGFGFVLLALLGVFLFLRWNRFGGRHRGGRRWAAMADGRGGQPGAPQATSQEGRDWKPPRMPWMRDSAAEIARERFARGEINADELGAILKGLDAE